MALILTFVNISQLADISDYRAMTLIGDGGPLSNVLDERVLHNHRRSDGWQVLVSKYLTEVADEIPSTESR